MASVATVSGGVGMGDVGAPTVNSILLTNGGTITFSNTGGIAGSPAATLGAISATTLVTTGLNTFSSANGLTALAGGAQAGTAVTAAINRVTTVVTAADSVQLPAALAGRRLVVINAAAANAMAVFPQTGEIINALAANASISLAANKTIEFYCAVAGTWNSLLTA